MGTRVSVVALVESVRASRVLTAREEALAAIAVSLAEALDSAPHVEKPTPPAPIARELRLTIAELCAGEAPDDDDDGWIGAAGGVPAEVGDAKGSGKSVTRPASRRGGKAAGEAVDAVAGTGRRRRPGAPAGP